MTPRDVLSGFVLDGHITDDEWIERAVGEGDAFGADMAANGWRGSESLAFLRARRGEHVVHVATHRLDLQTPRDEGRARVHHRGGSPDPWPARVDRRLRVAGPSGKADRRARGPRRSDLPCHAQWRWVTASVPTSPPDPRRMYELAAQDAERCADAHEKYARFVEEHGDPRAADEHRRRMSARRTQAAEYRQQAARLPAIGPRGGTSVSPATTGQTLALSSAAQATTDGPPVMSVARAPAVAERPASAVQRRHLRPSRRRIAGASVAVMLGLVGFGAAFTESRNGPSASATDPSTTRTTTTPAETAHSTTKASPHAPSPQTTPVRDDSAPTQPTSPPDPDPPSTDASTDDSSVPDDNVSEVTSADVPTAVAPVAGEAETYDAPTQLVIADPPPMPAIAAPVANAPTPPTANHTTQDSNGPSASSGNARGQGDANGGNKGNRSGRGHGNGM
jgi:hypothetical protein